MASCRVEAIGCCFCFFWLLLIFFLAAVGSLLRQLWYGRTNRVVCSGTCDVTRVCVCRVLCVYSPLSIVVCSIQPLFLLFILAQQPLCAEGEWSLKLADAVAQL